MIYLDNAATTFFKPAPIILAVSETLKHLSVNPGRSGHRLSVKGGLLVMETREKMARFLNLDKPENIIFTSNCTAALNLAILGTIKKGDHIITDVMEHNSVLRPLFEKQKELDLTITLLNPTGKDKIITPESVEKAICSNTSLIITAHMTNVCGTKNPIEEIGKIAKRHNIRFLVDAAQSGGIKKIDMKNNLDMVALAGHKGLHGPQGIGVLACKNNLPSPLIFGGTGTSSETLTQPFTPPESLESGTLNLPAIAGLNAAIDYMTRNNDFIEEQIEYLTKLLYNNLMNIHGLINYTPSSSMNGIISFNLNNTPSETVADILNSEYDVAVRSGLHCAPLAHKYLHTENTGAVRASLSFVNTTDEIKRFCNIINKISSKTK